LLLFLPDALINSLRQLKSFNEETFKNVHSSGQPLTSVRYNPAKHFEIEDSLLHIHDSVPWCPFGRYLTERPFFTFDPLLHAGAYYVQEASSMFLWHALAQTVGRNTKGLKVLDLCAAPGGKSTLLASYFTDGFIVANEVIRQRANILAENITKCGAANTAITNNDPKNFTSLTNYFDVIVVDAPCSGSGLFRKEPQAINEWSESNVELCSQRQQRILADVYPALKKDGILIYSTCSYSAEENEDILKWMSKAFAVCSLKLEVEADWGIIETVTENNNYGYRFFPDKVKGEGFFIAALKKTDGESSHQHYSVSITSPSKNEIASCEMIVKRQADLFYFKQVENIIAIPARWKEDIGLLQKKLYLRKAGITVGALKGKDMVPNHELALSSLLNENVPGIPLKYEDALLYLKKKEFIADHTTKGWTIVAYKGLALGWLKVLHNRINNYYPTEWRILKD